MEKLSLNEIIKITGAISNSAENIFFEGVTTDSRKISKGVLFVALKGEKFNGEDFAQDALNKGAAAVIVSKTAPNFDGVTLKVEDTLTAYQQIAKSWRERFQIPVVAITGSNGKTTTKDLTAAVLSSLGKVCKTSANFNNEIGVPMTLLEIDENHKAAVVEIGMRGLHQIENLAQFVKPTIGIVINVNETHIEILGSIENIARAKGELVQAIHGGTVILNADNFYTAEMKKIANPGTKILTYGIDNAADLTAENISVNGNSTIFDLKCNGEIFNFEIPIIGRHNVSNALATIATASEVGIEFSKIVDALSKFHGAKRRFQTKGNVKSIWIVDDYAHHPTEIVATLKAARETNPRRVICTGGYKFSQFAQSYQRIKIIFCKLRANFPVNFFRNCAEFQHIAQHCNFSAAVNFGDGFNSGLH